MSFAPDPDTPDLEAARLAGRTFAVDLDLRSKTEAYDPVAWRSGDSTHPTLQLDDVSAIPFLIDIAGVEEYQHRGRLRAGDHDVYVTVTPEM
ncbi:MAG: hypothetical protein OES69_19310, partial [Myxococcales bacterium]|nr:hypothetical protein [Myxococcales bacterium]